jgi:hypothetical protein
MLFIRRLPWAVEQEPATVSCVGEDDAGGCTDQHCQVGVGAVLVLRLLPILYSNSKLNINYCIYPCLCLQKSRSLLSNVRPFRRSSSAAKVPKLV